MDLKETDVLGEDIAHHWYYRSKANAVNRLLATLPASEIVDVGAGSAFFARHLLNNSNACEAWCVDTSYEREFDSCVAAKPIHFRRAIGSVNAGLVLMMDVLEHVDDDVGLLKMYAEKVPVGCNFLISVPAFKFLWSDHDVYLEHKRRYTLEQIEDTVERAGLKVERGMYYFGAIFPLAAVTRIIGNAIPRRSGEPKSQLRRHHPLVNSVLGGLSDIELSIMRRNRLFGLTAFCLAKSK